MSNSANPESASMDSGRKESGRISDSVNPESARMDSGRKESGKLSLSLKKSCEKCVQILLHWDGVR
jgi:hypothetical protein